jgi:hypothetical protein
LVYAWLYSWYIAGNQAVGDLGAELCAAPRRRNVHQVCKEWHNYCVTTPEFCNRLHIVLPNDQQYPWTEVHKWVRKGAGLIHEVDFRMDDAPGPGSVYHAYHSLEVRHLMLVALLHQYCRGLEERKTVAIVLAPKARGITCYFLVLHCITITHVPTGVILSLQALLLEDDMRAARETLQLVSDLGGPNVTHLEFHDVYTYADKCCKVIRFSPQPQCTGTVFLSLAMSCHHFKGLFPVWRRCHSTSHADCIKAVPR